MPPWVTIGFDLALGGLLALLVAFAAIIVIVLGGAALYGFVSAGMAMSRATRDGKLARTRGAARETNPHPHHTPIWHAWLRGWLGARQ